jgi:hypothetical protein
MGNAWRGKLPPPFVSKTKGETTLENWKTIEGYDGRFSVSDRGRVRRNPHISRCGRKLQAKIVPQTNNGAGYFKVKLYKDGRSIDAYVHRLVAAAFLFRPEGADEINHKDENRANNCADNLEWCDHTYNINYGWAAAHKYHAVIMCDLNGVQLKVYESIKHAEADTGINRSSISCVCRGLRKKAGGYSWRYI